MAVNREEQEKKNKRIGVLISLGTHALLVLLFFFLVAWRRPNPPLPEYGIELNFGLTDAGSGDIQPKSQEKVEEVMPEPEPEQEVEEQPEEVIKEQPVEEVVEDEPVQEEQVVKQPVQEEGPDVIEEKPQPKPVEKSAPKPEPKKTEEKKVNENAMYPGTNTKNEKNSETSQGDKGTAGDQGIKEGNIDSRALYGKQGGGDGGPIISLSNWNWDKVSLQKDPSSENGKIVFEIKVDDRGEIIAIRAIETTVSASVVKYYQNQVEDFTFTFNPSKPGATPASESTGTITLFIRPQ